MDEFSAYPRVFTEILELLKGLPGIGKRSAERMMLALYKWDDSKLEMLSELLGDFHKRVGVCCECGNLADMDESQEHIEKECLCAICTSPVRDKSLLCVVEESSQIRTIEASGTFRGIYHVLGGRIAPLEGRGIESITAERLAERIALGEIKEMILALSADVEGQATSVYLAGMFKECDLKISILARGLPAGSELTYADAATVAAALRGRIDFSQTNRF